VRLTCGCGTYQPQADASGQDATASDQGLGIEGSVLPEGRSLSFWGRETSGVKHLGWFTFKAHLRKTVPMTPYRTHLERLALSILDAKGIAAIWQLHLDAAYAHRTGYPTAAGAILELAEAAEREWLRRGNAPVHIGDWRR
jgi:hypothetical protein